MEFTAFFVILLRILVPLLIFKKPLTGALLAFGLDVLDHDSVIQLEHAGIVAYQPLDKLLDLYYFSIEALVAHRMWKNILAVRVSTFLYFFRLIGIVLFEITGIRFILILMPNLFEYFFIFYEVYRKFRNPKYLAANHIALVLFLLLLIKIPQEYTIHYAQISSRQWIRENVYDYRQIVE